MTTSQKCRIDGVAVAGSDDGFLRRGVITETTWAAVHKEAYALIAALKKFRNWVCGSERHCYFDHNHLLFISESAPKNAKLMRWCLTLQEFKIKFHYIRSRQNSR